MNTFLTVLQIFLSVILTFLIFIQSNGESESRSNIFSSVNFEKRGWEKVMFNITVAVLFMFLISSIVQTII